jgi:hypothetical protein
MCFGVFDWAVRGMYILLHARSFGKDSVKYSCCTALPRSASSLSRNPRVATDSGVMSSLHAQELTDDFRLFPTSLLPHRLPPRCADRAARCCRTLPSSSHGCPLLARAFPRPDLRQRTASSPLPRSSHLHACPPIGAQSMSNGTLKPL